MLGRKVKLDLKTPDPIIIKEEMNETLLASLQKLVEEEVKKQLMKYANVISKKHDISLKLLLQDISIITDLQKNESEESKNEPGQCLGVTAKKTQCKVSGVHDGYCMRHKDQKKDKPRNIDSLPIIDKNPHIGHTLKECMYLKGCPACEKSRGSQQNLLIDL